MKMLNMRLWLTASQRRTLSLAVYMLLFAAGCIAGTFCIINFKDNSLCKFCLMCGLPDTSSEGIKLFLSSLSYSIGILTLALCLGFCGIGQIFLTALLLFHGFSIGCILTSLSQDFTISILPLYALAALYTAAVSYIILLGIREAMNFSCTYVHVLLYGAESSDMRNRLHLYCLRFAVLMGILIIFSLLYTLLSGLIK